MRPDSRRSSFRRSTMFAAGLQVAAPRAMPAGVQSRLLRIALDHCTHVSDSLGPRAGVALLTVLADRLRNCVRGADFVARIGGDEFAILVEDASSEGALL